MGATSKISATNVPPVTEIEQQRGMIVGLFHEVKLLINDYY